MTVVPRVLSIQEFLLWLDAGLTAEIERHKDRTMTVVSLLGEETVTRCGTCPKEDTRPCTALRVLASRYAQHPAYRSEWQIARPDGRSSAAEEPRATVTDALIPPPYPRIADMPPPGNARRRLLREFGLKISPSDFTEEELAERGTASDLGKVRSRADARP